MPGGSANSRQLKEGFSLSNHNEQIIKRKPPPQRFGTAKNVSLVSLGKELDKHSPGALKLPLASAANAAKYFTHRNGSVPEMEDECRLLARRTLERQRALLYIKHRSPPREGSGRAAR